VLVILAITDEKMWVARNSQDKAKIVIPDMGPQITQIGYGINPDPSV